MQQLGEVPTDRTYTILRTSSIFGGIFNLIILLLYVLFTLSVPGRTRYFEFELTLLPLGIVLVTLFSFYHVTYDKKTSTTRCNLFPGLLISIMCLIPSILIFSIFFILPAIMSGSVFLPTAENICVLIPLILSTIGILLGILSIRSLGSCKKNIPEGFRQWKNKGLQVGTVFLIVGIIFLYASLSQGIIGDTELSYTITIVASEETTVFIPIPVSNTTGEAAHFMADLKIEKGNATWKLSETQYGQALEINTIGECKLSIREHCGYKSQEENDRWFETYTFSMIDDTFQNHSNVYTVYVYASKPNCTIKDITLTMDSGMGRILSYHIFSISLDEGWKTIGFEQSIACV